MNMEITSAIAAISTFVTAILLLMQFQLQKASSDPHATATVEEKRDGLLLVRLVIHPAQSATRFTRISVQNTFIGESVKAISDDGIAHETQPFDMSRSSVAFPVVLPPFRVSPDPFVGMFFIKDLNSISSIIICLHTQTMFFPVRYKIKAEARIER